MSKWQKSFFICKYFWCFFQWLFHRNKDILPKVSVTVIVSPHSNSILNLYKKFSLLNFWFWFMSSSFLSIGWKLSVLGIDPDCQVKLMSTSFREFWKLLYTFIFFWFDWCYKRRKVLCSLISDDSCDFYVVWRVSIMEYF